MIPVLQKILIISLVILQMATPLVHAHSGADYSGPFIHIPGLESLAVGTGDPQFSSFNCHFSHDQGIISIGPAIQHSVLDATDDCSTIILTQPVLPPSLILLNYVVNFSPHTDRLTSTPLISQHGPRAPPAFV